MPIDQLKEEISGRAKGGKATAAKLTPEQKAERARKGALARWGEKLPVAFRKGNFMGQFGFDAECYVLDDDHKTAVMTERGIASALGLSNPGGKDFQRLVSGKRLSQYLGAEVVEKIKNPIEFQWIYPGAKKSTVTFKGYGADTLIDVCNAILAADAAGKLLTHQAVLAKQARVILNASAKSGITNLVYALAGYRPEVEEIIQAFKLFVQQEAREYEREFPPQLYEHWYRLYQLNKPERGRPWKAKFLTIDHVYHPLARSSGKILELTRALKANGGDRSAKLHTFLSELGVKALRTHLGQLLGIAGISKSAQEYEQHVRTLFGDQPDLPGIDAA